MVKTALEYHAAVAHTRGRLSGLGLDWANQPAVFKTCGSLPYIPLPRQAGLPEATLWQALAERGGQGGAGLDMAGLSAVLFHALGLTRSSSQHGGTQFYRACPSAGALYPCEAYLSWPGGSGLGQGLYHYDAARHGLTLLREGTAHVDALGFAADTPDALIFISAIFFRSAWKYRARSYRYINLDAGHVVEGLSLGLSAYNVRHAVELGFDDDAVNTYLGLDKEREGCLAVLRLHSGQTAPQERPTGPHHKGEGGWCRMATADTLPEEVVQVHAACSVPFKGEGTLPDAEHSRLGLGLRWQKVPPLPRAGDAVGLFQAISSRRSRRVYAPMRLPDGALGLVLAALAAPLHGPGHPLENACLTGFLAVPGFFLFDRTRLRAAMVRDGNIGPVLAGICLDQNWMREAALQVVLLADLTTLEPTLGDRGYRAALIEAGRLGHRVYLAAESLGLGACGVGAFYDGDASDVLGLPEGTALTYVLNLGVPRGRDKLE